MVWVHKSWARVVANGLWLMVSTYSYTAGAGGEAVARVIALGAAGAGGEAVARAVARGAAGVGDLSGPLGSLDLSTKGLVAVRPACNRDTSASVKRSS